MSVMTVDGRLLRRDQTLRCDAAMVGSGPGGATVARTLAEAGADVIVLEEGPRLRPGQFPADPIAAPPGPNCRTGRLGRAGIRATSMGTVTPGRRRPRVRFGLIAEDVQPVKRAVRLLDEIMLAAGANLIAPGVAGWATRVSDPTTMATLESTRPADPKAYSLALSRMFGTCKMSTDPCTSVIRPDFRHRTADQLHGAGASVFPAGLGVSPQVSVMTMAQCRAEPIIRSAAAPPGHGRQA